MRVAIIGIGGTGSATARHLAKAGHTVTGYEQFQIGHDRGSSHGESRIIRYTYPDLLFTQIMGDAYPLWADLEAEAEERLLVRCGGLYFGDRNDSHVQITEASLQQVGLPYDVLEPSDMATRFPAMRLKPNEIALYQPESGFLRATRCVLAQARLAKRAGAVLRENTAVSGIEQHGAEVLVTTSEGETNRYDRVIVTAGAWMQSLFATLNLPLTVTRQQVTYLQIAQNAGYFQQGSLPVWIDSTANYYGFPQDGKIDGVKIACHDFGGTVHPDAVERTVDASYIDAVRDYARLRMPDLSSEVTYQQVCLYTVTHNEDFIIDTVPEMPHVLLVSGCSGHGFKFTALLGNIATLWATEQPYARDLSRFTLLRFRNSKGEVSNAHL